jgi:anti-sigma factor RsiW
VRCAAVQRAVDAYLDEELDTLAVLEVDEHLGECAECRRALASAVTIHSLLTADVLLDEPGPGLRARIMAQVESEAARSARGGLPGPGRPRAAAERAGTRRARLGRAAALGVLVIAFVAIPASHGPATAALTGDVIREHGRFEETAHLGQAAEALFVPSAAWAERWLEDQLRTPLVIPPSAGQGQPLVSTRLATVAARRAAQVVYARGGHRASLFIVPRLDVPAAKTGEAEIEGVDVYMGRAGDLLVSWWHHAGDLYLAAARPGHADLRALAAICIRTRRGVRRRRRSRDRQHG